MIIDKIVDIDFTECKNICSFCSTCACQVRITVELLQQFKIKGEGCKKFGQFRVTVYCEECRNVLLVKVAWDWVENVEVGYIEYSFDSPINSRTVGGAFVLDPFFSLKQLSKQ